jgi:hypothetical protein
LFFKKTAGWRIDRILFSFEKNSFAKWRKFAKKKGKKKTLVLPTPWHREWVVLQVQCRLVSHRQSPAATRTSTPPSLFLVSPVCQWLVSHAADAFLQLRT